MTSTLQTRLWLATAATVVIALGVWYTMRANHRPTQRTLVSNQTGCREIAGVQTAIENLSLNDLEKSKQAKDKLLRYAEASPVAARSSPY